MKKFFKRLALGILLALPWIGAASAQQANNYWCNSATVPCPPSAWTPASAANPSPVTATFTPSGTQNVNIAQILGAAPSLTNPLWVFPATGATFPVSGTVTTNQGTPNGKTTTQAKVTIATTNTYQQALASSSARAGCTVQYVAVVGTKGFVFFGSSPADTTTSFQLTNGQSINCSLGNEGVATDAIQVTATGTDIFIVSNQ